MEIKYPVASRALKKWVQNQLKSEELEPGKIHYKYEYHGSTCNNGGVPFTAILHAVVSEGEGCGIIDEAWIEIPEDQQENAAQMCSAPGKTAEEAQPFFKRLAEPAKFTGRTLEDVIMEDVPLNFAGCFCGVPHINQKWKIALSTIHYSRVQEKVSA